MVSIGESFAEAVRHDPTRPMLTWYDDASGDRTELSGVTLANWVAKSANLVVDAVGLEPGDLAAIELPPHWQTAAVLLGCWSAGLTVDLGVSLGPVDVAFVAADRIEPDGRVRDASGEATPLVAGDRFALALLPLAGRLRVVPDGFADYVVEVRGQGDRFTPATPVRPDDPAIRRPAALSHGEGYQRAVEHAVGLGLDRASRVLVDTGTHPDPLDWLLAPLAAGASVVLCANLDRALLTDRVAAERVTHTLTA